MKFKIKRKRAKPLNRRYTICIDDDMKKALDQINNKVEVTEMTRDFFKALIENTLKEPA